MRHLLDSYGMSNLILNIVKALKDEIDKEKYKNKHKLLQKRVQDCCIETLIYTYNKQKEGYLNLNNFNYKASISK